MAYWRCFYHIVWATHNRAPLITTGIEQVILQCIRHKSTELESPLIASNTVADHVHVAVCIPPKLAAADWVRRVKGYSSKEVNAAYPDQDTRFSWQEGYGVLTFGQKHVDFVQAYVAKQKEHHRDQTVIDYMEEMED